MNNTDMTEEDYKIALEAFSAIHSAKIQLAPSDDQIISEHVIKVERLLSKLCRINNE